MSNFKEKLKKLIESSFNDDKKRDNIHQKKIIIGKNSYIKSGFIYNSKIENFLLKEPIKPKNKSFISNFNNYKNKGEEQKSLYKKYKKYNSMFNQDKKSKYRNILATNKISNASKLNSMFDYSLASQIQFKNKRIIKNVPKLNYQTLDGFYNKNEENRKINDSTYKNKIIYRNKNYMNYHPNSLKKKNGSNRVENKIIQKIELIENENKIKKVKNLLINRSPIVFNKDSYKPLNYSYTYLVTKTKNKTMNQKQNLNNKNNNKNKNFLDLDDLKDVISSIKTKKYTIIRSKEFNDLNK